MPAAEWPLIRQGHKTEVRSTTQLLSLKDQKPPCLVVVWAQPRHIDPSKQLMVLEAKHKEPVGAITPEGLERECQESFAHFRRYWIHRTNARFKPLSDVHVYRLGLVRGRDLPTLGLELLRSLYRDDFPPT